MGKIPRQDSKDYNSKDSLEADVYTINFVTRASVPS